MSILNTAKLIRQSLRRGVYHSLTPRQNVVWTMDIHSEGNIDC